MLLWLAGFEGIGGEYFLMWQSHVWDGARSLPSASLHSVCSGSCFWRSANEHEVGGDYKCRLNGSGAFALPASKAGLERSAHYKGLTVLSIPAVTSLARSQVVQNDR